MLRKYDSIVCLKSGDDIDFIIDTRCVCYSFQRFIHYLLRTLYYKLYIINEYLHTIISKKLNWKLLWLKNEQSWF